MDDRDIVQKAFAENRILITNDKDFGERIYRERQLHRGVVLLRLEDERAAVKIEIVRLLLASYADRPADQYVVGAHEMWVRFARSKRKSSLRPFLTRARFSADKAARISSSDRSTGQPYTACMAAYSAGA